MAGMDLTLKVVRQQIASSVDLIVQQTRLKDGAHKINSIAEVADMEGDTVVLTEVFRYEQTGVTNDGKVHDDLKPTGVRPLFSPRLEAAGFKLGADVFGANLSEMLGRGQRR